MANISRKEAFTVLAFLCMVKVARPNSILFKKADYKMAAKIGMGDGRTFTNYLRKCQDLGLVETIHLRYNQNGIRSAYKFISYRKAVTLLLNVKDSQRRHFSIHRNLKFKQLQYEIEKDLVGISICQQVHQIKAHFPNKHDITAEINSLQRLPVSEKTKSVQRRKTKLVKRLSAADDQIKASKAMKHKDYVTTGCKHVARDLGVCDSTGHRRLKRWNQDGTIETKQVQVPIPVSSYIDAMYTIDSIKAQFKGKVIALYCEKRSEVVMILGQKVLGFQSANYSYGEVKKTSLRGVRLESATISEKSNPVI